MAVRRFIKCNFGLYDNVIDIDENWNFRFEFVGCPLRGECKSDKIICAPKFNSKLSDRQLEVMRLLYEGKSDSEIADRLFISLNTVNNHRKTVLEKSVYTRSLSLCGMLCKTTYSNNNNATLI